MGLMLDISPDEEKKQAVKHWGTKSGKTQESSKIKGFGTRYYGSTVSRLHVVLRSSASADRDQSTREKARKYAISGLFLYPKLFDLFSRILTNSDRRKVVNTEGTALFWASVVKF